MKKIFLIIVIALLSQMSFSQDLKDTKEDNYVYSSAGIEVQPAFPGGFKAFAEYVQRHYKYPNVKFLKGRVFVEFVINKEGDVEDIKVIRDIGYGTGEEAIRLMKNCPKWTPGMLNGLPINVRYSLPISIDIK